MNSNEAWIKAFTECLGNEYEDEIKTYLYGKIKRKQLASKYNLNFSLVEKLVENYLTENKLLIEILYYLKSKDFNIFIVSNAPRRRVVGDLDCCGITDLFNEVYTSDEGGKRNTSIFDNILAKYGLDFGFFIGNEEFDDYIEHPRIISMVLSSFLRTRFNILKSFDFDENGVIKINRS